MNAELLVVGFASAALVFGVIFLLVMFGKEVYRTQTH